MRILNQNILAIAPVFLFASIAIGALNYQISKREITWGLKEEAVALAISSAAHLEGDFVNLSRLNFESFDQKNPSQIGIKRVLSWNKAKRIFAYSLDTNSFLFNVSNASADSSNNQNDEQQKEIINKFRNDLPFFVSEVVEDKQKQSVLVALAPLEDEEEKRIGILGVQIDASTLQQSLDKVLLEAVYTSAIMLLLGIGVAAILSSLIRSKIYELLIFVKALAAEKFETYAKASWLRETNDLGNTFNTMSSLLKDNYNKAQCVLTNLTLSRQPKNLAEVFNNKFLPDRDYCFKLEKLKFEVAAGLADKLSTSDFFDVIEVKEKIYISIGQIKAENQEQEICQRSAFITAFERSLKRNEDVAVTFNELGNLFALKNWQCLELSISAEGNEIRLIQHLHDSKIQKLESKPITLTKGSPIIISSHSELGWRVKKLFEKLKHLDPSAIRTQLLPILNFDQHGATIILGAKL